MCLPEPAVPLEEIEAPGAGENFPANVSVKNDAAPH